MVGGLAIRDVVHLEGTQRLGIGRGKESLIFMFAQPIE